MVQRIAVTFSTATHVETKSLLPSQALLVHCNYRYVIMYETNENNSHAIGMITCIYNPKHCWILKLGFSTTIYITALEQTSASSRRICGDSSMKSFKSIPQLQLLKGCLVYSHQNTIQYPIVFSNMFINHCCPNFNKLHTIIPCLPIPDGSSLEAAMRPRKKKKTKAEYISMGKDLEIRTTHKNES